MSRMATNQAWQRMAGGGGVSITTADLPPGHRGLTAHQGDRAVVFVSRSLVPSLRLVVVAFELSLLERGGDMEAEPIPALPKRACALVMPHLVPLVELGPWVAEWVEVEMIDATVVAREFGVSVDVGEMSLLSLSRAA